VTQVLHLLGAPAVEVDGRPVRRPRGSKPWAVLALLALAERPVTRERLAGMLFGEADDPLGALRWSLAEARRLLDDPGALQGDPLVLDVPAGTVVDVRALTEGSWVAAEPLARRGGRLLEGMSFPADPAYDTWLAGERHRVEALRTGVLREAVLGRLAAGDALGAVPTARDLVASSPLDEGAHVLLVRALVQAGESDEARAAAGRCADVLARELGLGPSAAVQAELVSPRPVAGGPATRAGARAALAAGAAAVAAGAVDEGSARLREAAERARAAGDAETEVQALTELGYALVHGVRGRDEAGAAALAQAVSLADAAGRPELAVGAHRELGYTAFLAARYPEALRHLDDADRLLGAAGSDGERAACAAIRGAVLTDTAHYEEAVVVLDGAVRLAQDAGSVRWAVWATTMRARASLLLGAAEEAREPLERALRDARAAGLTSVVPWPQALLAEVDLLTGDVERAEEAAGEAFALGCELRDPCWEGTAGRVLGLVAKAQGRPDRARSVLVDARDRSGRVSDGWRFARAEVLDALASLAPDYPREGLAWISDLEAVAGAGGMRDLLVRAQLHRSALGQRDSLATARVLADGIASPALARRLAHA
jgi:DNA-binding SARP family transcriptional activator